MVSFAREAGVVEWLKMGRVPTVNVAGSLMDSSLVSVAADIEGRARVTVEHLHGAGYRNFLFVGWAQVDDSRHYREALARQLKPRGCRLLAIECPTLWYRDSPSSLSDPKTDARIVKLLKKAAKPLAAVGLTDFIAARICRFAQQLGLDIPRQVAVVGHGDTTETRIASPPITTIRSDYERMGYEAARLLHRMIGGTRSASKNVRVTGAELIARLSTAGANHHTTRSNMQLALDLVRRKACEGIRIPEVAAQMHMSKRTFQSQFAEEVGHSVGEELRRVRLERAKELLATTDLSVTRIAGLAGYTDLTYFTKFFREQTGQTPTDFRRQRSN